MSTTLMYVELVIIGSHVSAWIILLGAVFDDKTLNLIKASDNSTLVSIILLSFSYVLGILCDKIADHIFVNTEKKIRAKYFEDESIRTLKIWKLNDRMDDFNFTMTRKRIIRASILNIPLITFTLYSYLIKNKFHPLLILCSLLMGGVIFLITWFTHKKMISTYYANSKKLLANIKDKKSVMAEE